jgi:outer membrane protein assembly factor BamB
MVFSLMAQTRGRGQKQTVFVIATALCAAAAVGLLTAVGVLGDRGASDEGDGPEAPAGLPVREPPAVARDLPEVWPQSGSSSLGNPAWGDPAAAPFRELWRLETGYEFFSSPVLLDGVLYAGCNDSRFRALDALTGEVLWSFPVVCGLSGGASGDGTRIWFGGQDGFVYCLDRETGAKVWSTGLGFHVFSDAALFADTLVLAGTSMGGVAALDAETGLLVWEGSMDGLVLGPAVLDTTAVFVTESGGMTAFAPTGRVVWSRDFTSQPSAPTISGSTVFAGFSSGKVLALDLHSGATLWETQLPGVEGRTVVSRPVSAGSAVLAGTCDGRLVCLDAATGSLSWEAEFENWMQVPPAVCDTLVYASCDDMRLHVLSLIDGEEVCSVELDGYSGTQPVVAGGVVYLGTAGGDFMALEGTPPGVPDEPR